MRRASLCCLLAAGFSASFATARVDPSGIEFVTVGDPVNPNWRGEGFNDNRGAVNYAACGSLVGVEGICANYDAEGGGARSH